MAGTDPDVSDSPIPVTFTSIEERFVSCGSCHSQFRNDDGDLREVLLARNFYVTPFEPDSSRIVFKLEGSMLRFGGEDLAGLMRAWILKGALDD